MEGVREDVKDVTRCRGCGKGVKGMWQGVEDVRKVMVGVRAHLENKKESFESNKNSSSLLQTFIPTCTQLSTGVVEETQDNLSSETGAPILNEVIR